MTRRQPAPAGAAGASGSILAHRGGITCSQTVGETFGIVEARGTQSEGSIERVDAGKSISPHDSDELNL